MRGPCQLHKKIAQGDLDFMRLTACGKWPEEGFAIFQERVEYSVHQCQIGASNVNHGAHRPGELRSNTWPGVYPVI